MEGGLRGTEHRASREEREETLAEDPQEVASLHQTDRRDGPRQTPERLQARSRAASQPGGLPGEARRLYRPPQLLHLPELPARQETLGVRGPARRLRTIHTKRFSPAHRGRASLTVASSVPSRPIGRPRSTPPRERRLWRPPGFR